MPTRPLRRPLAHPQQAFLAVTLPTRGWLRLHWPGKAVTPAKTTAHRFTHANSAFDVLYLARDEHTAAMEVFGDRLYQKTVVDIPSAEWDVKEYSAIEVPELKVADLFSPKGIEEAQVDSSALSHTDLAIPQEWGLSVMTHADGLHGLLFASRFTKKKCLALFAAPADPKPTIEGTAWRFRDSKAAQRLLGKYTIKLT